jgi:hypothetical protein
MPSAFKRPALDLLAELRRGKVASELTDEIHDLVAACRDTGKKGSVTLTLTVEPDKDADMDREPRIRISDLITTKRPRRNVKPSMFFVTDDGNPTRQDPRQDAFEPLREVTHTDDTTEAATAREKAAR